LNYPVHRRLPNKIGMPCRLSPQIFSRYTCYLTLFDKRMAREDSRIFRLSPHNSQQISQVGKLFKLWRQV